MTTTIEARLAGVADEQQLEFVIVDGRVIFTQDADFLRLAADGRLHTGNAYAKQGTRVGRIVEFRMLIQLCLSEADIRGHIEFI